MKRLAILGALILGFPAIPSAGQDDQALGRLFFTRNQRAAMEHQRQNTAQAPSLAEETLSLEGVMQTSDGRRSVWINSHLQHESVPDRMPQADRGQSEHHQLSVDGSSPIRIKVGESIHRGSGEKRDFLAGGSVKVQRSLP